MIWEKGEEEVEEKRDERGMLTPLPAAKCRDETRELAEALRARCAVTPQRESFVYEKKDLLSRCRESRDKSPRRRIGRVRAAFRCLFVRSR